jgi:hypothetical protein
MTTTRRITIETYKEKFATYPQDLLDFAAQHELALPPLTTMRGQALALLAQPEVRGTCHVEPADAVDFFRGIGMETRDAIQQFNKATGVKRVKKRGIYCLQYPFEADTVDLEKRQGATINGDRDTIINSIKNWWRQNLVDVPNAEWQVGHLDPTINDASEANLAYQPPIQGKFRNRFKWDGLFLKMWPTAEELAPRFGSYYTEKEQKTLFEVLKQKFAE